MIRLRQIALVATDLEEAVRQVSGALDVDVVYRDPGVEFFGLQNALFCIGDQFIEIVSPLREGTTAGRLLEKHGGDCGYMALYEVDDLDVRIAHAKSLGIRTVWEGEMHGTRGRHLHPKDTGGTLVSLDQPASLGEWAWGGPIWKEHRPSSVANGLNSITVKCDDISHTQHQWNELGIPAHFVESQGTGDGLQSVELSTPDPVLNGTSITLLGTTFSLIHRP